jgi:hypothetical protein
LKKPPVKIGDFIDTRADIVGASWFDDAVTDLPVGSQVEAFNGTRWTKHDNKEWGVGWLCDEYGWHSGKRLHKWVKLVRIGEMGMALPLQPEVKPPGHTCPSIDEAQSMMRKLAWRANHPEHKSEISVEDLLKHGNAALEKVREENKQMREAYWTLKRRYTEEK